MQLLGKEDDNLPSYPVALRKLERMMRDPEVSIDELVRVIEIEPIASGKLIRMANSVYYNPGPNTINTLKLAVARLGMKASHRIVNSIFITALFRDSRLLEHYRFWKHNLSVASAASYLCARLGGTREECDSAYLQGLMHDIGIMVFTVIITAEYSELLKLASTSDQPLELLEKEHFDMDHAELGAVFLSEKWNMDETVCQSVRNHHLDCFDAKLNPRILTIANSFCNQQNITNGSGNFHPPFPEETWAVLNYSIADTQDILNKTRNFLSEAELLLSS